MEPRQKNELNMRAAIVEKAEIEHVIDANNMEINPTSPFSS